MFELHKNNILVMNLVEIYSWEKVEAFIFSASRFQVESCKYVVAVMGFGFELDVANGCTQTGVHDMRCYGGTSEENSHFYFDCLNLGVQAVVES